MKYAPSSHIAAIVVALLVTPALADSMLQHANSESQFDGSQLEIIVPPIDSTLIPNQSNEVVFRIQDKDGWPLDASAFEVVHTEPIHIVVLDPHYKDYHHVHPTQISEGLYRYEFTPTQDCNYQMWIDVTPQGGTQQFVPVKLNGSKDCEVNIKQMLNTTASVDNYDFILKKQSDLIAGQPAMLDIEVTKNGQPVHDLEPVMGAYSHMMAFYDDYKTIAHAHPTGKEPQRLNERGGPTLQFHLEPQKAGYLQLFVQVKIDGKDIYVPFGVMVELTT